MAKDMFGFEAGRKRDKQGRPLKLQTPPPNDAYRENWDRMFNKAPTMRGSMDLENVKALKEKADG